MAGRDEPIPICLRQLAHERDVRPSQGRPHHRLLVLEVPRPSRHLGRDEQAPAGQSGDLDGVEEPFFGRHPADETEVIAG